MSETGKQENPCCVMMRMEDNDNGGQKLINCLRGRLLAERQASRAAKEDVELLGKRLVELENRVREETKQRDRAEKKLISLKKKLQSLKTPCTLKEQDELFDNSDVSSVREDSMEKNEEDVKDEVDVRLGFSVPFRTASNSKTEEQRIIRQGVKGIQNFIEEKHVARANQYQTLIW